MTEFDNRVQFEAFIADHAARLTAVRLPLDLEHEIGQAMLELTGLIGADRCMLLGGAPGAGLSWITCSSGSADDPWPGLDFAAAFPWHFARLCGREQPVSVSRVADMPPDAATDRASAENLGIRSMLTVPVRSRDGGAHCLWILSLTEERHWPPFMAARLSVLTEAFVNALSRKRIDEARDVETRHADLLASVGAILWRADARTFQTTFVSREAEAILGYPVESWVKVPGFWRDHIHPDDRTWVETLSAKAVAEHRPLDFEYRMVVADGRTVWLRNIVKVLVDHGEATELVGVTVDVTHRKLAEFEAAQLRSQLAHAGRVTILGELAATLAHELNQPLGAMVSNAEAAQVFMDREPSALERLRPILDDIVRDGQRAGAIIHRVRRLLQKQPLETGPVDLGRLAEEMAGLARPLALSRQIALRVDVAEGLPAAHADVVHVQQVLLNLLQNAIDAVSGQPVDTRHILVRAARRGPDVELSVTDSGPGIPPERLPHLFEPFFTTKADGLGMGLPICRTIVRSHGGDIHVENNASGGATVGFTLPAYTAREGEP